MEELIDKLKPFQEDYYTREKAAQVLQLIDSHRNILEFSDLRISEQFREGCEILETLNEIPSIEVFAGVYAMGLLKIMMSLKNRTVQPMGPYY